MSENIDGDSKKKFRPFCVLQNHFFLFLHTLFAFLFKFMSLAYKHTFISLRHIICNIGCLKQTGK